MNFKKIKMNIGKVLSSMIGLIIFTSVLGSGIYAAMSARTGYQRSADNNTMETYKDVLLSDTPNGNGSRYAGRIWADKTVQTHANNSSDGNSYLRITEENDGKSGSVGYNADFLHVFSTLGSSQLVNQYSSKPIDVVLLLDISTSMTNYTDDNGDGSEDGVNIDTNDPLHQVINETNTLIDQLMGNDPDLPVHPQNRVGVVVYGGGTQELLTLGHYETLDGKDAYIKVDQVMKKDNGAYFPTIKTNVKEQEKTSQYMLADATYLQGALYQGMNMLANEPNTTYQDQVQGKVARTPVMITLTDGATNIVSASQTSAGGDNRYNWYEPMEGVIPNAAGARYSVTGANPIYADCNTSTGHGTSQDPSLRDSIENKQLEIQAISTRSVSNLLLAGYYKNKIEANYNTDMIDYSIGYNVGGVGDYAKEQLLATLDPKTYFDVSRQTEDDYPGQLATNEVEATKSAIEKYLENNPDDLAKMRFPRDPEKTYQFYPSDPVWANFTWNHPTDTANDLKSFDDIYYVNKYYTADNTEEVSNVFKEILELITTQTFTPIGGTNDNGVKDSLTYMDPIGDYMDIKENCITTDTTMGDNQTNDMAMLLFGEMHGLVRTGVYDYKFNHSHGGQNMKEGWYRNSDGEFIGKGETDSNWSVATYRLNGDTTRKYVSTLDESQGLTPQQENTIYTMYRFTDKSEDRNTPKYNPSYDKKENVTYKLSDIRVWSEYTGDYRDETGSGGAVDLGYDEALYVNIPVSALPVQVAKISLDQDGKVLEGGYETNLSKPNLNNPASTPFRLFYGVGIQDGIRSEDGTRIDIAKLSPEYISAHTDGKGNIYFNSNYWSGSLHKHSNGEEESIGDANFSFSPNSTNRYYAFQKPLILYKDPNLDTNPESHKDIEELGNNNYGSFKSGLEKVSDAGQLAPNNYYFIEGEYYVPTDTNGNAKETHILASRKGSEFGSEIPGATYGEYLEWYNPKTGDEAPYVPGAENGGKPTENEGQYVIATKPKGLRMGQICKQNNRKSPNVTETANNVYLPTVSQSSTEDNTVLNGYLGNNGVLRVKDSSLSITKEVEGYLGNQNYKEKEFNFELTMPSYASETIDATCIYRNDKYTDENSAQKWLIQPATIDIVTTNLGFIQTAEADPEQATTLATTPDGQYYLYVGNSLGEEIYHLYDETKDEDLHKNVEAPLPGVTKKELDDGSIEYCATVYLVPVNGFDAEHFVAPTAEDPKDEIVICELDATKDLESQIISKKYLTRTSYKTRQLKFDNHVAKFGLKDGEGILLMGLENGALFTVKEVLTDEQIKEGYRFDHAYNDTDITYDDTEVSGTVDNQYKSRGRHYVNRWLMPNNLSISKEVRGSEAQAEPDWENKEWEFNVKLTFKDDTFIEEHKDDSKINVNYSYYKKDEETPFKWGVTTFDRTSKGIYEGKITLKHDEKITLKDILSGTEYEVSEVNGGTDGDVNPDNYLTMLKGEDGFVYSPDSIKGIIGGDIDNVDSDILIEAINYNPAEYDITLEKQVKGETADYNKEWEFDITLTPPEDFRLADEYNYVIEAADGTQKNGKLKLGEPNADGTRVGKIKLKHNEKATIKNLPEGTTYKVVEDDENKNGYETTVPGNANGTLNQDENMTFVNSLIKYYGVQLKKTVAGHNSSESEYFTFRVTFTPGSEFGLRPIDYSFPNGNPSSGKLYVQGTLENPGSNDKQLTESNGSYYVDFKLKHNDIVYFTNIIEGTKYSIEEILAESQSGENGYEVRKPDNAEGTLNRANPSPNVEYVNIRYTLNDLMVSKNVEGEAGLRENRDFRFRITFKPAEDVEFKGSYPYEVRKGSNLTKWGVTKLNQKEDGTYFVEFTLKHDEHYTMKDIPERTQYWVEELDANQNDYKTDVTKGQSTGAYVGPNIDQDAEVEFTNRKIATYPLTIEKVVQGNNADSSRAFKFKVTLIPEEDVIEANEFQNSLSYTGTRSGRLPLVDNRDGTFTAEFTLKGGENIRFTEIPERTKYVVEELDANQDGYVEVESNNTEGTLDGSNQNVTVRYTNIKMEPGTLTLSKETEGGATENTEKLWHFEIKLTPPIGEQLGRIHYKTRSIIEGTTLLAEGDIDFVADEQNPGTYVGTVSFKHGQSVTLEGIPEGTNYELSESEANDDGFITYTQGSEKGTITGDIGIVVAYKNKKAAPMDLTLTKIVEGSRGDRNANWNFDIKLTPEENVEFATRYFYEGSGGKANGYIDLARQSDGSYLGHVQLKHGQSITIKNLPKGTKHEVTEREANQNDYTTEVVGQSTGVITEKGKQIEFKNTRIGVHDLSFTKTVMGRLGDRTRDWRFQIVLNVPKVSADTVTYGYVKYTQAGTQTTGTLTFTRNALGNYEAETTLKHGEKMTLQNIPEGSQYTVTEPESNQDGYTTTHSENCQGTLIQDGTTVQFVNRYLSTIDLTLQKIVEGLDGEYDRMWTYQITLTPPNGVSLNSSYHFSGSREGEITFTRGSNGLYTGTVQIKHGETLTIEGLPEETTYLVEELEANKDGYTTSNSGNTQGNLTVDMQNVVFTNSRKANLDLAIEKIVEGSEGDRTRNWTFEVTLTPPQGVTLDNFYMYTGSKIGNMNLTKNTDGTYTGIITLKHGEKITIQDIPEGTQYTVVEKEANTEGYTTTNTNNAEGTLESKVTPSVTFTNKKVGVRELEPEEPRNPLTPRRITTSTNVWNPRTGDNIKLFLTMFFVSVILIAISVGEITKNRKSK